MKQQTMDEVYRRWFKPVRSWIRSRNVPTIWIEDIAQEVFLKLMRYNPEMEVESNIAGYVFRTAANVTAEWLERSHIKKQHKSTDTEDQGIPDELQESGEEILEQRQLIQQIELSISKIKGRRLLILMMHIYDEKPYKDIAKELGLTYRIVLRELTTAYTQLRQDMKRSGLLDLYLIDFEEKEDGRSDISESTGTDVASVRDSTHDVGINS